MRSCNAWRHCRVSYALFWSGVMRNARTPNKRSLVLEKISASHVRITSSDRDFLSRCDMRSARPARVFAEMTHSIRTRHVFLWLCSSTVSPGRIFRTFSRLYRITYLTPSSRIFSIHSGHVCSEWVRGILDFTQFLPLWVIVFSSIVLVQVNV